MSGRSRARWGLVGVAVALGVATAWSRTPLGEPLEVAVYRDDAYYYFDWVRNLVDGRGPRVGVAPPTSGVHLAWCALLVPLYAVGGDAGLEHGARWLGLALLLLAGGVVVRALWTRGVAAPLALAIGLGTVGHPDAWSEAQNGQETALAIAALALLLCAGAPGRRDDVGAAHRAGRSELWFAGACVLLTFARSDLWPMALAVAACRPGGWPRRLAAPAAALALVLAANLALAGRPLPDSAEPMAWLFGARLDAQIAAGRDPLEALWWWGRPVLFGIPFERFAAFGTASLLALAVGARVPRPLAALALAALPIAAVAGVDHLLVPLAAAALLALPGRRAWRPPPGAARLATGLTLAGLALVFAHHVLRVYPRPYYFVPLAVSGAFGLGLLARSGHPLAALAVALALGHHALALATPPLRHPLQRAHAVAGQELDRFVPAGAVVGAFNSGILTWHRHPAPVLNLDGVVHRAALEALQAGRMADFLDAEGVRWLCDNPVQFALDPLLPHACGRWFGDGFDPDRDLVAVARVLVPGVRGDRPGTDAVVLYRRAGAGPVPVPPPGPAEVRPAVDGHGLVLAWVGRDGERLRVTAAGGAVVADVAAVPGVTLLLALPELPADPRAVVCEVVPPRPR